MRFLAPAMLVALPLVGLPILIHLVNRWRYHTVEWGAMRLIMEAQRHASATAKLRYFLILLVRMVAIAALLLVLSRPLVTGWAGLSLAGSAETVVVVLDRSASMEQRDAVTGISRRQAAITRIDEMRNSLGSNARVVLIESTRSAPVELGDAKLADLPDIGSSSTAANLPAQLEEALNYVRQNQTGRTDIWVCSDLRAADWNIESGRWSGLRDAFGELPGVRFLLLSYDAPVKDNLSVTVGNVQRRSASGKNELTMDLSVRQSAPQLGSQKVAVEFVINGARSQVEINLVDGQFYASGFALPLDSSLTQGTGFIELPVDSNPQDNTFYFAFSDPPVRRTVVVSDDEYVGELLKLVAEVPVDAATKTSAQWLTSSQVGQIDWNQTAMVIWQAPIPDGTVRDQLESFVRQGRTVLMLPPSSPKAESLLQNTPVSLEKGKRIFETGWDSSYISEPESLSVLNWRADVDLLANTEVGSLDLGSVSVRRYCSMSVENASVLAGLENGKPLLARAITEAGAAYFLATLPVEPYSTLTNNNNEMIFYIMVQRALESAATSVGAARQVVAGSEAAADLADWESRGYREEETTLSQRSFQSGAYEKEGQLIALNRPESEDLLNTISSDEISNLMGPLPHQVIRDSTDKKKSFSHEIWRTFQIAMILGLLAEAFLCLPSKEKQ